MIDIKIEYKLSGVMDMCNNTIERSGPLILKYIGRKYLINDMTVINKFGTSMVLFLGGEISIIFQSQACIYNIELFMEDRSMGIKYKLPKNKLTSNMISFMSKNILSYPEPKYNSEELSIVPSEYVIEFMRNNSDFELYYDKDEVDLLRMEKLVNN